MALEGRNIGSGGIGSGQAQVYSQTQNAVNTYARTIAQQQAKREAEQKALADKLSQFSTEGLREVDKEGFYQVYDGWKNKTYDAMKAKDPKEKFRLQAEAEKDRQKAAKYVFDSKAKTQRDLAMGAKVLGKPHFFNEQGKQIFNKSLSAPIYSKDDIVDYNSIPLGYDKSKVVENVTKLNNELLKQGKYDEVEGVTKKVGDLTVAEFKKIKRVDPKSQYSAYEMLYRGDDGFKALVEESYPQLDWDNNEPQAIQMALTDMVTKSPLVKDEGVERRSVPNRDMTDYQKMSLAIRQANAQGEEDVSTPIQLDIPFAKGKGRVRINEYFKMPTTKQNFAGSEYIDMKTGKPELNKLPSSGDYEVVGVANFPVIKSGNFKGSISQPKYAEKDPNNIVPTPMIHVQVPMAEGRKKDILIPYNRLAATAKSKKALSNFIPATSTSNKKTIKGF
jgi:hypothetical protein